MFRDILEILLFLLCLWCLLLWVFVGGWLFLVLAIAIAYLATEFVRKEKS